MYKKSDPSIFLKTASVEMQSHYKKDEKKQHYTWCFDFISLFCRQVMRIFLWIEMKCVAFGLILSDLPVVDLIAKFTIRCCNLIDLKVRFQRKDYLEADPAWPGSRVDRHHPVEDFYFICKNVSAWKRALKSRKRCRNLFMQNIQLGFIVDVAWQWRNFFFEWRKFQTFS